MKPGVMRGICAFVAQQITVGACLPEAGIGVGRKLSERKGDGGLGPGCTDFRDQAGQFLRGRRILAALQDKGAQAEPPGILAAAEDAFPGQGIAPYTRIAAPDAAVEAVVAADVAPFDEGTQEDLPSEVRLGGFPGGGEKASIGGGIFAREQFHETGIAERPLFSQFFDKKLHLSGKDTFSFGQKFRIFEV